MKKKREKKEKQKQQQKGNQQKQNKKKNKNKKNFVGEGVGRKVVGERSQQGVVDRRTSCVCVCVCVFVWVEKRKEFCFCNNNKKESFFVERFGWAKKSLFVKDLGLSTKKKKKIRSHIVCNSHINIFFDPEDNEEIFVLSEIRKKKQSRVFWNNNNY